MTGCRVDRHDNSRAHHVRSLGAHGAWAPAEGADGAKRNAAGHLLRRPWRKTAPPDAKTVAHFATGRVRQNLRQQFCVKATHQISSLWSSSQTSWAPLRELGS